MRKKGWIIYQKQDAINNSSYIDWFIGECNQLHLDLRLILREDLHIGIQNGKWIVLVNGVQYDVPEFAVIRTIDPLISKQLELMGVKVFNSSQIATICNNKAYTYQTMLSLGLPMVDSIFLNKEQLPYTPPLEFPFVVKTVSGRGGKEVEMIRTIEEWYPFISKPHSEDLVMQSCNVELGKDLRVYVVGKKIIGAVLRESNEDFRANYALGGHANNYELSEEEQTLVETIIQQFDFGMVGIDFLFSKDGNLLFNEIEDVVGSRMLSAVSNVNIVREYVSHIYNKLMSRN